jgi:hypothetical protein
MNEVLEAEDLPSVIADLAGQLSDLDDDLGDAAAALRQAGANPAAIGRVGAQRRALEIRRDDLTTALAAARQAHADGLAAQQKAQLVADAEQARAALAQAVEQRVQQATELEACINRAADLLLAFDASGRDIADMYRPGGAAHRATHLSQRLLVDDTELGYVANRMLAQRVGSDLWPFSEPRSLMTANHRESVAREVAAEAAVILRNFDQALASRIDAAAAGG